LSSIACSRSFFGPGTGWLESGGPEGIFFAHAGILVGLL
jgi:hypothetical protein